jgi:hypothetical protein
MKKTKTAISPSFPVTLALFLTLSSIAFQHTFAERKPEAYALIFGTVYDANNRPLPGIRLKIARMKGTERGKTWEHVSDRRGEFAQRVPAGTADYLVWTDTKVTKGNERPRAEVKVHIENDERQDIGLHLTQ